LGEPDIIAKMKVRSRGVRDTAGTADAARTWVSPDYKPTVRIKAGPLLLRSCD